MFLDGKTFTCCAFGVNINASMEHHFVSMLAVCLEKMGTASKVFLRYSWPKMLWTFVAWWLIFSLCESDRVYFPDSFLGRTMVGAICWDAPRIRWLFSRKTGFRGSSWVMRSRWRIVGFNQWVGVFHGGLSLVQTKALWKGIPTRNMNLYIPMIYRLQQDMNSGSCFQPSSLNYSYLLFLHIIIIKIQSPLTDN